MWNVQDVGCSGCGMFGMFTMRDVGYVGCWRWGMFGMWNVRDAGCSGCGMFRTWDVRDVRDVGCLPGCRVLTYKMPFGKEIMSMLYQTFKYSNMNIPKRSTKTAK